MTYSEKQSPFQGANLAELAIEPLTMSSREIAELCDKQHKHVLRDIRVMLIELYGDEHIEKFVPEQYRNRHSEYVRENADAILDAISAAGPDWGQSGRPYKWQRDSRGRISEFSLSKDLTLTLVSGYNVKLRKRIIDKLDEAENAMRDPAHLLDRALNSPKHAATLLLQQVEKVQELTFTVEAQQEEIAELAPEASAWRHIAVREGAYTPRQAAKVLQQPERKFVQGLIELGWLYRSKNAASSGRLLGYSSREKSGHIAHRYHTYQNSSGEDAVSAQVVITPKGMQVLAKKFAVELPMLLPPGDQPGLEALK